ncbi:uncharacterized protein V6R79_009737 [Siganus canaliculatus]
MSALTSVGEERGGGKEASESLSMDVCMKSGTTSGGRKGQYSTRGLKVRVNGSEQGQRARSHLRRNEDQRVLAVFSDPKFQNQPKGEKEKYACPLLCEK